MAARVRTGSGSDWVLPLRNAGREPTPIGPICKNPVATAPGSDSCGYRFPREALEIYKFLNTQSVIIWYQCLTCAGLVMPWRWVG